MAARQRFSAGLASLGLIALFGAFTPSSLLASAAAAGTSRPLTPLGSEDVERNRPAPPVRVADNLYWVGTRDIGAYLFVDPAGMILLDTGYEQSVPLVLANIRALGFDPRRIRILLTSQAHYDHVGGLGAIKAATGARVYASPADAAQLARGGRGDFAFGDRFAFPAVKADHLLRDGETVRLGALRLTAHLTPGHTRGCTSWSLSASDRGRSYPALFVCGASAPGYRLVGNDAYPQIMEDFARSFATWRRLPCQIFLGAHGVYFDLEAKRAAMRSGGPNPFIDPDGCRRFLDAAERGLLDQAKRQAAAR